MKVIDLSHTLENGMPVFPGDPKPVFEVQGDVQAGDVYTLIQFEMTTHTGTHLDCNTHVKPAGFRTDGMDLSYFIGKGVVVDCSRYKEGEFITVDTLKEYDLSDKQFVLLYCGWDKYWGRDAFCGSFPVLSKEAAGYLADMDHIRGLGVEYISIDPLHDPDLALHQIFLNGKDKCVIENLCNLDRLLGRDFLFCALPLKFKNGEGSPVRAAAILDCCE